MVTDMHRLERAARLAMASVQDMAPEILPPRPTFRPAQRLAVLVAVAAALAVALFCL